VRVTESRAGGVPPSRQSPSSFVPSSWKSEQGLPGNWIECILQTRDGYLWLGTPEGLIRFDGIRFVRFNHENCPAFKSDIVKALAEDTKVASGWRPKPAASCA